MSVPRQCERLYPYAQHNEVSIKIMTYPCQRLIQDFLLDGSPTLLEGAPIPDAVAFLRNLHVKIIIKELEPIVGWGLFVRCVDFDVVSVSTVFGLYLPHIPCTLHDEGAL